LDFPDHHHCANVGAHFVDQVELFLHVTAIATHAEVDAQAKLVNHVQWLVD